MDIQTIIKLLNKRTTTVEIILDQLKVMIDKYQQDKEDLYISQYFEQLNFTSSKKPSEEQISRATEKIVKDIGVDNIYVVALADADPQKKADWIEDKIKSGVDDVFFIDDSHKNVAAVKALAKKYPKISLKVRHVQHETPAAPKQDDTKGNKKEKDFIKGKPMANNNDMRLKNLLPKQDLEKKIKNPETGKMIKLGSALKYDKDTKAYKAAQFALKKK